MDVRIAALVALLVSAGCNAITKDLLGGASGGDAGAGGMDAGKDAAMLADAPPDAAIKPPGDMLILDYEFEDGSGTTVTDSARGLDATLSDSAMWTANGRNGKGIAMTATTPATQYVSLPDGILTDVDDFTISVWVKLSSNPAWARIYDIGNGLPDPSNRFMYLTTNGFTTQGMSDGIHASSYGGSPTNESVIGSYTFLPVNVWKHLAIVGSGGQRKLYIDGFPAVSIDDGPAVAPREMEPIAPNSWLGRSRFSADPGFPGVMDEFRVYSRVLTPAEIEDLAWPKDDYSYWRFDDGTGSACKDSSNHALATALANGATWTTGRLGGAVAFAGGAGSQSGPHVVIAGNPLAACSSQFTIAAWVRIDAYATGSRLFDFGKGTTHDLYLSPNDGTGMHFNMTSPAGTLDIQTSTPPIPADSTWHHVAITMDAGNVVVLYVDGVALQTQPSSTVRASDFADLDELFLGKSRAADPYFDGAIDELRIGCRALTPDEIKNLSHP